MAGMAGQTRSATTQILSLLFEPRHCLSILSLSPDFEGPLVLCRPRILSARPEFSLCLPSLQDPRSFWATSHIRSWTTQGPQSCLGFHTLISAPGCRPLILSVSLLLSSHFSRDPHLCLGPECYYPYPYGSLSLLKLLSLFRLPSPVKAKGPSFLLGPPILSQPAFLSYTPKCPRLRADPK